MQDRSEYRSQRRRARWAQPTEEVLAQLPVEVEMMSDFDDPDPDAPPHRARTMRPVSPVKGEDDDSLVDPQLSFGITGELVEGSYICKAAALSHLRASVMRALALPPDFAEPFATVEVLRVVGPGPGSPVEEIFDPSILDVRRMIESPSFAASAPLDEIAAAAAHRGAALLDRIRPGWHREVDPETLDQGRGLWCVLAQLYGSYQNGLIALEGCMRHSDGDLGFDEGTRSLERFQAPRMFEYLTFAWRYEISRRLNVATGL